jgi:flagellar export protein FliJ
MLARRFRFRLDAVERLRRSVCDAQQRVVGEAARAVTTARSKETSWTNDLQGSFAQSRRVQSAARMDMVWLRTYHLHCSWLRRTIELAGVEVADKLKTLEEERTKLAEASKQLKVIQKLRERQWQRHVQEVKREEQAINDEAAVHMFLRNVQPSMVKEAV